MYLLTRPKPKLMSSVTRFQSAGLDTVGVATFDIEPDPLSINYLAQLGYSIATVYIVTSTFAASIAASAKLIPEDASVIAVGPSTAKRLELDGFNAEVPASSDSEGVLNLLATKSTKPARVIIIKGKGGRTEIRDRLLAQGIEVIESNVYRRVPLNAPLTTRNWNWHQVDAVIATSLELANSLIDAYQLHLLGTKKWLVVSERIKHQLLLSGISDIDVCNEASDSELINWIKKNWE